MRVVVLGAGFGGLEVCRRLADEDVDVVVVDRQNHHLFQPLLYQVATAGLAAPEIAQPIRSILRDQSNVRVLMDEVTGADLDARQVMLRRSGPLAYDRLVVATGAVTHYFGNDAWAPHAPGLKTLADARAIRARVLRAFEAAELEEDDRRRRELMRIVVIGGGPTGVELAGSLAELAKRVLQRDFTRIDPAQAQIVLLEVAPRVLTGFSERLSESARRQLGQLDVDVRVAQEIVSIREGVVELEWGELHAATILWGAGVRAAPFADSLGIEQDGRGRVAVREDLRLPDHPEVFAIGDVAKVIDGRGVEVPGVAPAAIQMGRHVAEEIVEEARSPERATGSLRGPAFVYRDRGMMATLGRTKAVAQVGRIELSGLPAWLAWLAVHLTWLIGFRNKVFVLLQWFYAYVAYRRGARVIEALSDTGDADAAAVLRDDAENADDDASAAERRGASRAI
jgi:NADH dehydrogenase